ncbi:MAG TPA: patatin-like protein [Allosphingosinicella sp.]|nr:patatin-like protein [Allosphingosinicella sp.]
MREKELRIALVCYGGISLAVYMHGITKEIWRLACASRAFHDPGSTEPGGRASADVYSTLLSTLRQRAGLDLRVLVDILAGASAGGINAIFLGHAIAGGRSLDPLTDLWLESADVDKLIDPSVSGFSRFAKGAAVPFAWALSARAGTVDATVEPEHRAEVRAKLSSFVRARWFAPPFGGPGLTNLLLDAFEAMDRGSAGPPLLPDYQPLDLFVTVTDFRGHPETLRLNSPPQVIEREHRVTLSFHDPAGPSRSFADPIELTFAARATASFPGAFPPFTVAELDKVLDTRGRRWPGRAAFLARALPRHAEAGTADEAVLIDGSVLANAPFGPAIAALEQRPARREVDRRFVYIDPKPGLKSVSLSAAADAEPPGFFATILGALSDIPREQPIRDNLEAIEHLSGRIRRLRRIVEAMQPEVEAAIERALGSTFFLERPTPKRFAAWRSRANDLAARTAGYAYAAYAHLKIAAVVEEAAEAILRLGALDRSERENVRQAIWAHVREAGIVDQSAVSARGLDEDLILFLRDLDRGFRTRRLRFIARRIPQLVESREDGERIRALLNEMLGRYQARAPKRLDDSSARAFAAAETAPAGALAALARLWNLRALDEETDLRLAEALASLARPDRRKLILAYLGYPFYDVATLPLLQGEGLDEFDPIKVDRISPDDALAIRKGGTAATLKGIQLNSFGAFFSRAYRENDYLWGRLHGADRLIDIALSTLPDGDGLPAPEVTALKRQAFRAILAEEKPRLKAIPALFESLEREVG